MYLLWVTLKKKIQIETSFALHDIFHDPFRHVFLAG